MIEEKINYCLSCINSPCSNGCPLNNNISKITKLMKEHSYEEAYQELNKTTVLPSICGRICPNENLCRGKCVRNIKSSPVEIGTIEAYLGDLGIKNNWKINSPTTTEYNVAIIGGGPAGLTCAAFLRRNGIGVTIYEKYNYLGGLLVHGIPEYRLPKSIVKSSVDKIINLGIDVKYNMELGKNIMINDIETKHDAIFLSFGANCSNKMNIAGEDLTGVLGAYELLEQQIELDFTDKTVIISGGGNVALDAARIIKRKGAKKVIIVYRRSRNEMPADNHEIEEAIKDNIEFLYQHNIIKINGTSKVESIELIKTKLIKKENEERLTPINIDGTNTTLNCDYVIMAIGSHADKNITESLGIDLTSNYKIKVHDKAKTNKENIFCGGDLGANQAIVSTASRSGRDAANLIIDYLRSKDYEENKIK